ncbi:AMP-binding protein [Alicyclobacillus fastidiosus]|uniref:AMP-binding protein n=1 Tax=Alicyclobacillus fastidiosus TaxID=392011 RepID=A0ABV5AKY1_9BACL|nr:AMP-binding protein [Alicyclobacillus fastidiosus]WEH10188.1 AMP-binding protein [Alicyclobacillus fastidiosus]
MSTFLTSLEQVLSAEHRPILFDHDTWHSTSQLRNDVLQVKHALWDAGLRERDEVVLGLPNSYEFAVVYLALLQSGVVVAPVNPKMPAAELERVLTRLDAKAVMVSQAQADAWNRVLCDHEFGANLNIDLAPTEGAGTPLSIVVSLAPSRLSQTAESTPEGATGDDAPAVLMFTSGTTGQPKGVMLRRKHLLHAANNVIQSHELTEEDVAYCILPLFHINAQVIVLLSTLLSGGQLVMADRFHASRFWDDVTSHRVTWVSAVPTILSILSKQQSKARPAHQLRFIRSASAPLSPAIKTRFECSVGVPVVESYGMTEAAGQICINPLPPGVRKVGSVGKPFGLELEILNDEQQPVGPNDVGEIVIRGQNVIEAYVGAEGKQSDSQWDGWIFTGDLGYRDDDGYVFITGRAKEIINRAGEKLSPREIEDVLSGHSFVDRSAVIGVPDPLYGERVVAFVVPVDYETVAKGALVNELEQMCKDSLAHHKCPSEIVVARSLPVGPTGKVQKHLLRDVQTLHLLA